MTEAKRRWLARLRVHQFVAVAIGALVLETAFRFAGPGMHGISTLGGISRTLWFLVAVVQILIAFRSSRDYPEAWPGITLATLTMFGLWTYTWLFLFTNTYGE